MRETGYAEDWLILNIITLLDSLAVQPRPYPERKYHLRGYIGT